MKFSSGLLIIGLLVLPGCTGRYAATAGSVPTAFAASPIRKPIVTQPTPTAPGVLSRAEKIVASARSQIGDAYVADYVNIDYPNGDVPKGTGACTDVVVRAYRAIGVDFQKLVHQDMKKNFSLYPKRWGLRRTDTNIDHRRVPNLVTYWKRFGTSLPTGTTGKSGATWKPGDIVVWKLDNGLDHCGILTEAKGPTGLPTVIHNLGQCAEENCLTTWRIVGHYRPLPVVRVEKTEHGYSRSVEIQTSKL
jgi:uncharacterized protein